MGTNYYVVQNHCSHCNRHDRLHIGKKSIGWAFTFQGYVVEPWITSWGEWKQYLKDKQIVDEYGTSIDYDRFCLLVEGSGSPSYIREDGHQNLLHNKDARNRGWFNSKYDWDDDSGYSFTSREFS